MDKCRCKLSLSAVKQHFYNGQPQGSGVSLEFSAQYDTNIPEDQRFAKATPSANFTMYVDNPSAVEFFKDGGVFYVDFSKTGV